MAWITEANFLSFFPGSSKSFTTASMTAWIPVAEQMIESFIGEREMEETEYWSWVDGWGTPNIVLNQYPITDFYEATCETEDAIRIQNNSAGANESFVSVHNGYLFLEVQGSTNESSTGVLLSTYSTLALLETAVEALGTGWLITVDNEGEPKTIKPRSAGSCLNVNTFLETPYDAMEGISVDKNSGVLHRYQGFPKGSQNIFVHYKAGYTTIPAQLQAICARLVWKLLNETKRDPSMRHEKLDDYEYTIGGAAGGGALEEFKDELAPFISYRTG